MQSKNWRPKVQKDGILQTATKQMTMDRNRKSSTIWWIHNETCYQLGLSITATRSCPYSPNIISGIMVKIFRRHKQ